MLCCYYFFQPRYVLLFYLSIFLTQFSPGTIQLTPERRNDICDVHSCRQNGALLLRYFVTAQSTFLSRAAVSQRAKKVNRKEVEKMCCIVQGLVIPSHSSQYLKRKFYWYVSRYACVAGSKQQWPPSFSHNGPGDVKKQHAADTFVWLFAVIFNHLRHKIIWGFIYSRFTNTGKFVVRGALHPIFLGPYSPTSLNVCMYMRGVGQD